MLVAVLAASCSTQKNTRASRAYHAMKVNYNIYFNGYTAFEEGLQDIARANKDDYTQVLNLYPVSKTHIDCDYLRCQLRDAQGRYAWSNPIFLK